MKKIAMALFALAAAGCASSSQFVRNDELLEIGQRPVPPQVYANPIAKVDRWELQGPLATRTGHAPLTPSAPIDALLVAQAGGRYQPSQDLTCVARERARFAAANEGLPPRLLSGFIDTRCGVPLANPQVRLLAGKVEDSFSDAELLQHWGPQISQMLAEVPAGSHAGLAMSRANGTAVVCLAAQVDELDLEPIELVPGAGTLVVKGTMRVNAQSVFAAINEGDSRARA